MGVTARQRPTTLPAVGSARVLVVEVPGWAPTRMAAERAVVTLGWRLGLTPADADILMVCGQPGEAWRSVLDNLWAQLADPRLRVDALTPDDARDVLHAAATRLLVGAAAEPAEDADRPDADTDSAREGDAGEGDGGEGEGGGGHGEGDGGHGEGDSDSTGDGGDMDMPMPGGIPLAGGDQDRDGLEMDVLTATLGPVLPAWPAGLELRCELHGDMIAHAEVTTLLGQDPVEERRGEDWRVHLALDCDGVARLLALAGRDDAALAFRRIRDDLLDGAPTVKCLAAVSFWRNRLRRSPWLRWSLRGLGDLDQSELSHRGLPAWMAGDVLDRLLARVAGIVDVLTSGGRSHIAVDRGRAARAAIDVLPDLVTGLELGAARLVVASIDPDVAALQNGYRRA